MATLRTSIVQDTLELIADRLNEYFQVADPAPDPWVALSNIVDQQGQMLEETRNKLVLFLANIEQDTTISTWNAYSPSGPDKYAQGQPTIYINLYLLCYANFSGEHYPQGLGMVSKTIQFFQENSYFDHKNLPGLPAPIEKIAFELTNLDAVGLSYLMGLAGVKYLPSAYYKVRTLPFQSNVIQQQVATMKGYTPSLGAYDTRAVNSDEPDSTSEAAPKRGRSR